MTERIVVGTILYDSVDGFNLLTEDGDFHRLDIEEERGFEMPLNEKVAILVDENWKVSDSYNFFEPVGAPKLVNEKNKRIVVFSRSGNADSAEGLAKYSNNFWSQVSEGYWTVDARGYALDQQYSDCRPEPYSYCSDAMRRTWSSLPEEDKPDWYPNYWHIAGGYYQSMCGQALVGGSVGATYSDGSGCGATTTAHELGHNFGLRHSNALDFRGEAVEYADKTSVMGGHGAEGLNIANVFYLGFFKEDEVKVISTNSQVVVCPWEMSKSMRAENEKPIIIIDNGSTERARYFVSVRKSKGYPYAPNESEVLYLHKGSNDSLLLDELKVGESSDKIPNVTITHLEHENEVSLVDVKFDNQNEAPNSEEIYPVAFPNHIDGVELSDKHDGLWYNEKMDGQGFDLYVKNGRMNMYWYTFRNTIMPEWFTIAADLTNGPELFDIYMTEGGSFSDPASAEPVVIGKGQLYFLDDKNGVFNYITQMHGRGSIPITPVVTSNGPKDGAYYNPDRNYEGFSLRFLNEGERCVGYWYTYRDTNRFFPELDKNWFLLDGVLQSDGSYLLDMNILKGNFIQYNDEAEPRLLGQVKLIPNGDGFVFESTVENYELTSQLQKLF
jgi:hypothetical protein